MPPLDFKQLFLMADNQRNDTAVDRAIASYSDIAELAQQEGEMLMQARALHLAGVAAGESVTDEGSSHFRDAFKYFREAETLLRQADSVVWLGALYRDMAITYDCAGDYGQALVYFEKSLSALEDMQAYAELAITYDKIGLHFHLLGDQETALRYIDKALDTFRKDKPHGFYSATTLLDKARILTKRGSLNQAYDVAIESVSWFEADHGESSFRRRLAQLYGLLALLAAKTGQEKQAKFYWQKFEGTTADMDPLALTVIKKDLERLFS